MMFEEEGFNRRRILDLPGRFIANTSYSRDQMSYEADRRRNEENANNATQRVEDRTWSRE